MGRSSRNVAKPHGRGPRKWLRGGKRRGQPSKAADSTEARAARVAEMDVTRFIAHLGRLGIPAIRLTAAEANADLDTLDQWLQSSSPMPAH